MAAHIHGMPLKNIAENNDFDEEEETEENFECCQVEKYGVHLCAANKYYKRHKLCQLHAKAPIVLLAGLRQRFCQQCSRFHEVSEFDGTKRSCRRHLVGHNERRRKTPLAINLEDNQCRQMNEENRQQITLPNRSASFKTYHIL